MRFSPVAAAFNTASVPGRIPVMDKGSFAAYLGRMDRAELAELRRVRPEAAESPGGFEVRAERLGDRGSLAAMRLVSRDAIAAGQAAAALGAEATVDSVAASTGGDADAVRSALGELRRVGVACELPPVVRTPRLR